MPVEHEGVSAVVYNPELEKFLVLKRAKNKEFYPGKWEFPGGKLEDEIPEDCVLRELEEETGFKGEILEQEDGFEWKSEYGMVRTYPFLIKVTSSDVETSREHIDYRWVSIGQLSGLEMYTGNRMTLETLGVK